MINPELFAPLVNLHVFLSSADFFKINFFKEILSRIPSECQTVWIQIRPDALSLGGKELKCHLELAAEGIFKIHSSEA